MSNNINIFGTEYQGIEGLVVSGTDGTSYTYIVPTGTLSVTANGTYDVTQYEKTTVTITPSLQVKEQTITPSIEEQTITITPDSGYQGLSGVSLSVEAVKDAWTHIDIENNTLSVSGATSTTTAVINYTIPHINLDNAQCVYVRIQNTNDIPDVPPVGTNNSYYFLNSNTFFINNFINSPINMGAIYVYRKSELEDNILTAITSVDNGYGIYASSLEKNNNDWTIKFSYKKANNSGTIMDGDYQVDVFTLDFPTEYPLPF